MAEGFASTLAELSLNTERLSGSAFDARLLEEENGSYQNRGPRPKTRQDAADLKAELEHEFLAPSSQFSPEWLNRLQRFVGSFLIIWSPPLFHASVVFR